MKKSELNKYIKENILSSLSESTEDEIEKTKELTQAVQDLESAKKEAGIEEANIGSADLEEMGYEAGEKSFDMHFDKSILKNRPDTKSYTKGFVQSIIDSAASLTPTEEIPMFKGTRDALDSISIREEEDEEPTKKDIKKTKGLAKAKKELALLTQEMKSLAKKYSKAEGEDKEKLVKTLKAKTKLKKELESILDNKKI